LSSALARRKSDEENKSAKALHQGAAVAQR
jgi:hypothetical protein